MVLIEIVDASPERLMGVFNIQSAGWSLDDNVLLDKKTLAVVSFKVSFEIQEEYTPFQFWRLNIKEIDAAFRI